MIRTAEQYRESIRDGREVWINGERVDDVTTHPAFKPLVDVRARIYDMAHEPATADVMSYADEDAGERHAIGLKLPHTREDWHAKRRGGGCGDGRRAAASSSASATRRWARCGRSTTAATC